MQITYIIALLFALIVAVFAIQNAQPVTVDFMFNRFEISLALVILVSVFAGALILGFLGIFRQVKAGLKLRDANSKMKRLEQQLKETEDKLNTSQHELSKLTDGLLGNVEETEDETASQPRAEE